ncbi:MAG: DnaB-like helicase C-terminal domain-containing protein [Bacillota bacterium]|nr:AAA family ATPase [Bacillota bacterium]
MDYQQVVDELKNKIDLVKFIGQYTQLKKTGRIHQGICVLHPDSSTPSLTVYPDTQSYYCFGCKSGGSIIEFVKAHYNYDFFEAINFLAQYAGIDIKAEDTPQAKARRERIKTNERAVLASQKQLLSAGLAREYLKSRGFSQETIDAFDIGYDASENSIVIPLKDGYGKTVGFSRRFLEPGQGPKYKNSKNDEVFNKGRILYNLDNARKHAGSSLLVLEGYFDVLSAWQSGYKNSVAICKDTLTEDQASLITKVCKGKKVILVPDNDETGIRSVLANRDLLRARDPSLHIQVAPPPEGCKDLNDVLLTSGEEGVRKTIDNAFSVDIFAVRQILATEADAEKQYTLVRDYMKTIDNILVVEDIIHELAAKWNHSQGSIRQFLDLGGGKASYWFPHDTVLERRMLASILAQPKFLDIAADKLNGDCFYILEHRIIFESMLSIYQSTGSFTQTDLYMALKANGRLDNVEAKIADLGVGTSDDLELEAMWKNLLDFYYQRKLLTAALEIAESISHNREDNFDRIQARAQDLVFSATDASTTTPVHRMNDLLANRWEEYLRRAEGIAPRGLLTGYFCLDNIIGGFQNKHLIVLAASTSTGKSAMALNIARNVLSRDPAVPVAIVSLEMSAEEIMDRLIISELEVDGFRYSQGNLTEEELLKFQTNINNLYNKPLLISDERGLTVTQIRARLRRMRAELGSLGLVVVDYLQTIQLEASNNISTARATGDVVLQLRNLASELNVPILLISQINRSYSQRADRRPQLSDLRESGNIEEFADMVIFLYNHSRQSAAAYEEALANDALNVVDVIVAKNRTGKTGITKLKFLDNHMLFTDPYTDSLAESAPGTSPFDDQGGS